MNEGLELHRYVPSKIPDLCQRQFSCGNDTGHAEIGEKPDRFGCRHGHLGARVQGKRRERAMQIRKDTKVLHDHTVEAFFNERRKERL